MKVPDFACKKKNLTFYNFSHAFTNSSNLTDLKLKVVYKNSESETKKITSILKNIAMIINIVKFAEILFQSFAKSQCRDLAT